MIHEWINRRRSRAADKAICDWYRYQHGGGDVVDDEVDMTKQVPSPELDLVTLLQPPEVSRDRLRRYGLDRERFDELLASQGGACAICRRDGDDVDLVIDHCHDTGAVRGMLCNACNIGLGMFRDDAEALERAIAYLETGPADAA